MDRRGGIDRAGRCAVAEGVDTDVRDTGPPDLQGVPAQAFTHGKPAICAAVTVTDAEDAILITRTHIAVHGVLGYQGGLRGAVDAVDLGAVDIDERATRVGTVCPGEAHVAVAVGAISPDR